MGTTLRSALRHTDVRHCDVVELVPETYECMPFFHHDAEAVLADPRLRCFVDDGRNFLLMRPQLYDVITIDPSPPVHGAGTVNLYSREFIELCRARLNPGGIVCLWVPPWWGSEVRLIMSTFLSVFPNSHAWGGPVAPGIYLLGLGDTAALDTSRFQRDNGNDAILADLREWNECPSLMSVAGLAVMNAAELAAFLDGVAVITDDMPRTEFPIWRSIFDPAYRQLLTAVDLAKHKERMAAQFPGWPAPSAPSADHHR
jgi:spermidine synthase